VSDRELSCREVVELVNDHLDGHMTLEERSRFERHLDDCPHCVVYLEQMRQTIAAVGRLSAAALDPGVQAELAHAFRRRR
jgi:anti-sigma factor RsiW